MSALISLAERYRLEHKKSKLPTGVYKNRDKYNVTITYEKVKYHVGRFSTVAQAERARNKACTEGIKDSEGKMIVPPKKDFIPDYLQQSKTPHPNLNVIWNDYTNELSQLSRQLTNAQRTIS